MPGPLSRFAFALLLTGFALVMAMLWLLNHLPSPAKGQRPPASHAPARP